MPEIKSDKIPSYSKEPNNTAFAPIETAYDSIPQNPQPSTERCGFCWEMGIAIFILILAAFPILLAAFYLLFGIARFLATITNTIPFPALVLIIVGIFMWGKDK